MWQVLHAELSAFMLPHAFMLAVVKLASVIQPDHSASRRSVAWVAFSVPAGGGVPVPPLERAASSLASQSVMLALSASLYVTPLWPGAICVMIGASGVQLPTSAV